MTDKISIVINLDSRPGFLEQSSTVNTAKLGGGTKSLDYFVEGVHNKVEFFKGWDLEVTLFIDAHERLPKTVEDKLLSMNDSHLVSNLIFNRHTETFIEGPFFPKWLDLNILNAITMARGKYVAHFDQDMAAFIQDRSVIKEWIGWLDEGKYDYISYPSRYSPMPVNDPDFDYAWVSSRFFFCKRELFDYTEILKCLRSNEYLYGKYGEKKRKCPWLEHVMGIIAGLGKVFYPPIEPDRFLLFSWSQYYSGLLGTLNSMSYTNVRDYVKRCGGIGYPCDIRGREI